MLCSSKERDLLMKINEDNFMKQLKMKDEKALDYVIDTYGGLIKSIVKKHLYNLEQLQDEAINDILLAVWYHIDSFNVEKSSFQNWLGAVSKYKCVDCKRKYLKPLETENIDDLRIESTFSVEKEIIKKSLSEDIESLLNNLNSKDREIFLKYYVEEMDINILSQEMDIKTSVIYNRLSRGRSKLRNISGVK